MEYNVEELSPTQRKISVTVPAQDVNAAMDAAVREYGAGLSLDGFRKGKVPASVVEKRFPREVLTRATDNLVNAEIPKAMEETKLRPINRIQFDGQRVARDSDYAFSFSFDVLPEITLPEDFSAMSVEVPSEELTEAEGEEIMGRIRKSLASLEPVTEDRVAAYNDVVRVDVHGTHDGKDVEGMKVENYSMQLQEPKEGGKNLEIDAVILTLKPGEEGTGIMNCPDDYPDPELRGKDVEFTVKLHSISKEVLPEMDDELAKKVGFENIEGLRDMVLQQAKAGKLRDVRLLGQNKLLASVLDGMDFPLPESMVNLHFGEYMAEQRNRMMSQGANSGMINDSLSNAREEGLEAARVQAKSQAFLTALAFREGIEVTEQDLTRQIMQMAQESRQDFNKLADALVESGRIDDLRDKILASKALDFMYTQAKKIVVDADGKPLPEDKGGDAPTAAE